MTDDRWPAPGTAASDVLSAWLPRMYVSSGFRAEGDAPCVRLSLSGTQGGDWELRAEEELLRVEQLPVGGRRGRPDPDVWIRQTTADFMAALHPDPDLPPLLPPGWSPLDLLFVDPRDAELMRKISGRLLVEVDGRRRRRWALDVGFGTAGVTAGRPRAIVRIDGATYDGLRTGTKAPLQALLEGHVRLEGDRTLAMQALLLVGARLARGAR